MRIVSMHVLLKQGEQVIFLKSSYELGFISFLKRGYAKQTLNFGARTCISKISKTQTVKVELSEMENSLLYAHVDNLGISVVVITDFDYPEMAAKKVIIQALNSFRNRFSFDQIESLKGDQNLNFPELDQLIQKFQDPKEADKLLKIESDLDEIQNMLTKTMSDLLDRGESLDDLMKKSEDISSTAYIFYDKSKEANKKCCSIY